MPIGVIATIPVGTNPTTGVITPDGSFIYIANSGDGTVSVISTATNTVVSTITVGTYPVSGAITSDGRFVYMPNQIGNTVSVIEVATNTVIATVGVGSGPQFCAITPDNAYVYVANGGGNTVSVIEVVTNTVIATVTVGTAPNWVQTETDNTHVYVTNTGSASVSVIAIATNTVAFTIPVGNDPAFLAITPTGAYVYVTNYTDGTVSVISTVTNTVVATVTVGTGPQFCAITPNGSFVYVTNTNSATVSVISVLSNLVIDTVGVGSGPLFGAITPDGSQVYIGNLGSGTVSVIATATNTVIATVTVGSAPLVSITPNNAFAYVANNGSATVDVISTTITPIQTPLPILEISPSNPLSLFPEWVDITQWCMGIDTAYGRQHELQQIEAQTVQALMDNVTGLFSSWNFSSPFTNLLQFADSVIPAISGETSNWQADVNSTVTFAGNGLDPEFPTLLITATGSGDASAVIGLAGFVAVTPGQVYTGFTSFKALTTGRSCTVGIVWLDSGHSVLSTSTGAAIGDLTGTYTKGVVTAAAPANAAFGTLILTVESAGASESHFTQRFGMTQRYTDISSGFELDVSAWGPGGYGLTIGNRLRVAGSAGGVGTVVAFGYLEKSVPTITNELVKSQTLNAADAFKYYANEAISSSLYPGLVILDGASIYWRLSDVVGTTIVADASLNGNLGTVVGNWQFQLPGLRNAASGPWSGGADAATSAHAPTYSADYITSGIVSPAAGQTRLSIEVIANINASQVIMGFASGAILLDINPSGYATAIINGSAVITGSTSLFGGTHHFVLEYYDSVGDTALFVDGELIGTATATSGLASSLGAFIVYSSPQVTVQDVAFYPFLLLDVQVADHFDLAIAGFSVPGGGTTSDLLILMLLLGNGFPLGMMLFEVGSFHVICPTTTPGTTTLISMVNQIVATEQGLLYQDHNGYFVFLNGAYAILAPLATTVQATFENATGSPYLYLPAGFQPSLDDEDLWNDVPTQVTGGGTVAQGVSTGVTYGPLHDIQDSVSIGNFGKRSLQGFTGMLYQNDLDCVDLGEWLLFLYSVPYTRVRQIQISSAANQGAALPQMFERDLLDLIEVIYHPQDAGMDFDSMAQLEKIQHKITPGVLWVTTWQLTPYFVSGPWLTLGPWIPDPSVTTLDGPGKLAFAGGSRS